MDSTKRSAFCTYLDRQIQHYDAEAKQLSSDHREDEAVFAKIRMNVYDLFRSVFSASFKIPGNSGDASERFFCEKLQQIPENWRSSLRQAEANGDSKRVHLEQIKLETAAAISHVYHSYVEVSL